MEYRDYFLDKFYKTNKAYCPSCDLKPIKQEELDIILKPIKEKIIKSLQEKGINNIDEIMQNMDRVENLYIGSISSLMGTTLNHETNKHVIFVNKDYVDYDESGNIIGFKDSLIRQIELALGHELIHDGARKKSGVTGIQNGKMKINERYGKLVKEDFDINTGLNEGFTQLIAEKIFGFSVSPNTDGYAFYKKIAEVLCFTFGEKYVIDSYFNNPENIEIMCNRISQNPMFYYDLNRLLTLNNITKKVAGHYTAGQELARKQEIVTIKQIVAGIVVPKMLNQTEEEKQEYLKLISQLFSDIPEYRDIFEKTVVQYFNMDEKEMVTAKNKISKLNTQLRKEFYILNEVISPKGNLFDVKDNKAIDEDGKVAQEQLQLTGELRELVLSKQFEHAQPVLAKALSSEKVVKLFSKQKNKDQKLQFMPQQSIIEKQECFSHIKGKLRDNGIIVLNSVQEVTDEDEMDIISIGADKKFEIEDLQKLLEVFLIENTEDGQVIKNRNTDEIVTDISLIRKIRFADLWHNAVKSNVASKTIGGSLEDSFNNDLVDIYEQIKQVFQNNIQNEPELDLMRLYEEFEKKNDYRLSSIAYELFSSKKNYLIVYAYFRSMMDKAGRETELPIALNDLDGSWQSEFETSDWHVEQIWKKIEDDKKKQTIFSETGGRDTITGEEIGKKTGKEVLFSKNGREALDRAVADIDRILEQHMKNG